MLPDTLRTDSLVKRYGKRTVVRGVTIEVRRGEPIRCKRYCSVASVCPQWQAETQTDTEGRQPGVAAQA